MTDYEKHKETGEVMEWPDDQLITEIKEPKQLKLQELNLFKLAQNDSFGSNIGV